MSNWFLDEEFHLDRADSLGLEVEGDLSVDTTYHHSPLTTRELVIQGELSAVVRHTIALDLLPLIPEKFHSSQILRDYVTVVGVEFGIFLTSIRDIVKLLGPNTVASSLFLRHLGALIGVKFPPEDESTPAELRKTLAQAIDWYKMKGTYKSLDIFSLIDTFTINLYDMYTNDYESFLLVDWFVGDEDENPPGLDSSYYKSPHFGVEIVLDQVYTPSGTSLNYLWRSSFGDNFIAKVNETRPVHTVPHILILLNPKTDEFGNVIETNGEIRSKVTSDWQYGAGYFDRPGSQNEWQFDDGGVGFDSSAEGFISSITKWVLGTGNYPCDLESSATSSLEFPALEGTIDSDNITIEDEYFQFEFIVPKEIEQDDISELGLYIPGSPDTLVFLSCFPKIQKTDDVELRVVVQVYKSDLS
jgi:hypothetical protein